MRVFLAVPLLAVALVGCSDQVDAGPTDAGVDAGVDAGADAGLQPSDGGHDGGLDGGVLDAGGSCLAPDGSGAWEVLPALSALGGDTPTGASSIAVLGDTPYLAFVESNEGPPNAAVYVQRWSGTAWEPIGGANSLDMHAAYNSITLDRAGRPLLVWQEASATVPDVVVRRFESGSWSDLGAVIGLGTGADETPYITTTESRGPYVTWKRSGLVPSAEVVVVEWDGAAWTEVAGPIAASPGFDAIAAFPKVAALRDQLFVSWLEQNRASGAARYHVAELVGDAWSELGDPVDAPWGARHHMVLDHEGHPALVLLMDDLEVHVRRWTGTDWYALPSAGAGLARVDSISQPTLAIDHRDRPVVAFWARRPGAIFVLRYETGTWRVLGIHGGAGSTPASGPGLALTTCGEPVVTWPAMSGSTHVARYHRGADE